MQKYVELSRQNLKSFSNFDIFKYSLASLAVAYNWSKVILKISLDDIYKYRQQELEEFIKNEFSKYPEHRLGIFLISLLAFHVNNLSTSL